MTMNDMTAAQNLAAACNSSFTKEARAHFYDQFELKTWLNLVDDGKLRVCDLQSKYQQPIFDYLVEHGKIAA